MVIIDLYQFLFYGEYLGYEIRITRVKDLGYTKLQMSFSDVIVDDAII